MKVYFIRHGQTYNNVKMLFGGWSQAQLTDEGREQARRAGERLKDISFDRIYASDLDRTRETASLIFPDKEIVYTPVIREINVGSLSGHPYSKGDELARHSYNFTPFGGENREQLIDRITRFLHEIEPLSLSCERIAAVTHGGLICNILDTITGGNIGTKHSTCGNCSISVFEYIPERGWRLVKWNDTGDLP